MSSNQRDNKSGNSNTRISKMKDIKSEIGDLMNKIDTASR